jgi:hypothetical protein
MFGVAVTANWNVAVAGSAMPGLFGIAFTSTVNTSIFRPATSPSAKTTMYPARSCVRIVRASVVVFDSRIVSDESSIDFGPGSFNAVPTKDCESTVVPVIDQPVASVTCGDRSVPASSSPRDGAAVFAIVATQ